jgi:Immunoglobulin domain
VPVTINDHLSSPDPTVIQEGKDVTIVCSVSGIPTPEVVWYRQLRSGQMSEDDAVKCIVLAGMPYQSSSNARTYG